MEISYNYFDSKTLGGSLLISNWGVTESQESDLILLDYYYVMHSQSILELWCGPLHGFMEKDKSSDALRKIVGRKIDENEICYFIRRDKSNERLKSSN